MGKIRILVADDHAVVRMGLTSLLSSQKDIEVVGEARDGEEALALVRSTRPDVTILDLMMPRLDGAAATARIRAWDSRTKILILTSFGTSDKVAQALAAGAAGAILKSATNDELLAAVRAVAAGKSVGTDALGEMDEAVARDSPLTPRQVEILDLISRGLTNPEIGDVLGIGAESVKSHVSKILARIGAATRSEAVRIAVRERLLPDV